MKKTLTMLSFCLAASLPAFAQSTVEKAKETGNDVKREVKKGGHRVEEAVCLAGDAECAAKKAKNRVIEAKDTVVDKAKATKDTLDSDNK